MEEGGGVVGGETRSIGTAKSCAAGEHPPEKRLGEQIDGDNRTAPSRQIEKGGQHFNLATLHLLVGVFDDLLVRTAA
jgi:hypothetical protein